MESTAQLEPDRVLARMVAQITGTLLLFVVTDLDNPFFGAWNLRKDPLVKLADRL